MFTKLNSKINDVCFRMAFKINPEMFLVTRDGYAVYFGAKDEHIHVFNPRTGKLVSTELW